MPLPLLHRSLTTNQQEVDISFRFRPNGDQALDESLVVGDGVESVSRTGEGEFTVVLKGYYPKVIAIHADLWSSTIAEGHKIVPQLPTSDIAAGTTTFLLQYLENDDGVFGPVEIPSAAGNWIVVTVKAKRSSV